METEMIFTWDLNIESFNQIRGQPNLLDLRREFEMRGHSLSPSLLIWETNTRESYSLSDIGNKRFYYIIQRPNAEMEVYEGDWDSVTLRIPPLSYEVHGTFEGFIDWLKLIGLDMTDLEHLKRSDLSHQKRDFEIVYDDLLAAYELLRGILVSPRESLLDLSNDNVQNIRIYLGQFWELIDRIKGVASSIPMDKHTEVSQQILQFCDEVKQQLGQIVTHLESKRSEQLETQVNTTVAEAMEELKTETDLLRKQQEEAKENESARQKEFAELQSKLADERAKKLTSEQQVTFAEQAERHQDAAWAWLGVASSLVIGLVAGIIFWGLLDILKLEGTEWTVVLQNIFKKGSVLTLFYFALSRSIKNYTAQKHLEVVNGHRQRALDTFPELIESSGNNPETRHAVLSAATNAIFDANQSGYLSTKTKGTESVNPIQQVFGAMRSSSIRSED